MTDEMLSADELQALEQELRGLRAEMCTQSEVRRKATCALVELEDRRHELQERISAHDRAFLREHCLVREEY